MEKREWNDAFAPVRPDAGLRYKVLKLTREEKETRSTRRLATRLAAVAAVITIVLTAALWPRQTENNIVTAPGVLKVYAYDIVDSMVDVSQLQSVELTEGAQSSWLGGWSVTNNMIYGLPVTFSVPEEDFGGAKITFAISTEGGEFFRELNGEYGKYYFGPAYLGQVFRLENHQTIFWWFLETDMKNWHEEYDEDKFQESIRAGLDGKEPTYIGPSLKGIHYQGVTDVKVTIYADDHVVGCMLLQIYADDTSYPDGDAAYGGCHYFLRMVKSESYPMLDGEYQFVSAEYVNGLMDSWSAG